MVSQGWGEPLVAACLTCETVCRLYRNRCLQMPVVVQLRSAMLEVFDTLLSRSESEGSLGWPEEVVEAHARVVMVVSQTGSSARSP